MLAIHVEKLYLRKNLLWFPKIVGKFTGHFCGLSKLVCTQGPREDAFDKLNVVRVLSL